MRATAVDNPLLSESTLVVEISIAPDDRPVVAIPAGDSFLGKSRLLNSLPREVCPRSYGCPMDASISLAEVSSREVSSVTPTAATHERSRPLWRKS